MPVLTLLRFDREAIQEHATGTVWNLSTHPENELKIVQEGALPPLIKLLRSRDVLIARQACGALRNVSVNDEAREDIVDEGGLSAVIHLLKSTDAGTLEHASVLLRNLSVPTNNKDKIAKEGGLAVRPCGDWSTCVLPIGNQGTRTHTGERPVARVPGMGMNKSGKNEIERNDRK
jgi:vacuolar protein 8